MPGARTFVVVGASLAGGTAAATLREDGFDGRLVLIGDEPSLPYERPGLSKAYLRGAKSRDELLVRPAEWWEAHGIETRLGVRARSIDPRERTVTLSDGQRIAFDRALVATGVRNRTLRRSRLGPSRRLPAPHGRRTPTRSVERRPVPGAPSSSGMGFIGAEVAASLRQLGLEVTVVELFETALYRVLGPRLGRVLEEIHRDHGVELRFQDTVERFEGSAASNASSPVPVGRSRRTSWSSAWGRSRMRRSWTPRRSRPTAVSPRARRWRPRSPASSPPGDVASHRHPVFGEVRVEHYDNAIKMGVHAARAMLGATEAYDDPHWFWSDQWDHEIQMSGVAASGEMIVRGSLEARSFAAFFLDDERILRACVSIDWNRDCRRSLRLIRKQARIDPAALADPEVDLRRLDPD